MTIGSSAWAHQRIGGVAHRRIGMGTLNGNGNGNLVRERESGTGTERGTRNGNGNTERERKTEHGKNSLNVKFSAIFLNMHKKLPLVGFEPGTSGLVVKRSTTTPFGCVVGLPHYIWKAQSTYKMSQKLMHDDPNHIHVEPKHTDDEPNHLHVRCRRPYTCR